MQCGFCKCDGTLKCEKAPNTSEDLERIRREDEATIFVLAGAMISTIQLSAAKDKFGFVNIMQKVSMILKQDPLFMRRFAAEQKAVMDEFNKIIKPSDLPNPSTLGVQ